MPPFSSVELSINGACNRRCHFCPRVVKEDYPNILDSLNMQLFDDLINDLVSISFDGRIAFQDFVNHYCQKI